MADQAVLNCPACGQTQQFKISITGGGQGETPHHCSKCRAVIYIQFKNGKITGLRKGH